MRRRVGSNGIENLEIGIKGKREKLHHLRQSKSFEDSVNKKSNVRAQDCWVKRHISATGCYECLYLI
jgi:hypothetical protein